MRIIFVAVLILLQTVFLSQAEARGGKSSGGHSYSSKSKSSKSYGSGYGGSSSNNSSGCPCSGSNDCVGPRGGTYCITSGGNKRYR